MRRRAAAKPQEFPGTSCFVHGLECGWKWTEPQKMLFPTCQVRVSRFCQSCFLLLVQIECQNIYIYIQYISNIYLQMVCQKRCPNNVSGWGSLEESTFTDYKGYILYIISISIFVQWAIYTPPHWTVPHLLTLTWVVFMLAKMLRESICQVAWGSFLSLGSNFAGWWQTL
jgi:hypothetical protein